MSSLRNHKPYFTLKTILFVYVLLNRVRVKYRRVSQLLDKIST